MVQRALRRILRHAARALVTKRVTLFPYKSSACDVRSRRSFPIKSARSVNFISGDEIHQERALRLRLLNEI